MIVQVQWEYTQVADGFWNVTFLNVSGGYELSGPYPLQGVGTVQDVDFYFRASHDDWEFETNDEKGWLFPGDDKRAFQRSGKYTGAGEMPHREAAEIIAACVTELVAQIA